jgi:metallophosphoesterase (TIGR00282 family)
MIGDVVGDPGLEVLERRLPLIIKENSINFVMVNGENAAGGFGLTAPLFERILAAGADIVTGGNHIWEKREFWPTLDEDKSIIRPMNYPIGSPGRGWVILQKPSPWEDTEPTTISWVAVNLQGREFMSSLDCPFKCFDAFETELAAQNPQEKPIILVDFHAESTREKESLAYYLDGRVTALAGTHTHIQTADERLLPKGSAYITDLGMTGTQDGVIGMDKKICIDRARNQVLYRMEVAAPTEGKAAVQGIIVEIDFETGMALSIRRI